MAFNTKVDVADTELEANEAVVDTGDVTLEDEALVEAESDADEDNEEMDEEADESEDSLTYSNGVIEKIVAMATREVPHVLGMKGNLMHFVQEQFGAENLTKGVILQIGRSRSCLSSFLTLLLVCPYYSTTFFYRQPNFL